ncbi:MAG: amylo-alpha-1,6-glucosidase [Bacteroidia bacterium]
MFTTLGASTLSRFDHAINYEWLETNGLGGYASSTVIGANTRRYHGLLVAALTPPVGRTILLSKLDETLIVGDRRYELGSNKYRGAVYPNGYIFQASFQKTLFPTFVFEAAGVKLRKTIAAIHGENTTVITYEVLEAPEDFVMELLPLYAPRDFHQVSRATQPYLDGTSFHEGTLCVQATPDAPYLHLTVPSSWLIAQPDWYYNLEYAIEQERGMEAHEDLFSPGRLAVHLQAGSRLGIVASAQPTAGRDAFDLLRQEERRRMTLLHQQTLKGSPFDTLGLAADQFIVQRDDKLRSIIAGYHWFSDWGRDTMIALPGLCLTTGRYDDARLILSAFARSASEGMLPNRFPDSGAAPEYNTIDATLWFFVAVYKYLRSTNDRTFVEQEMLPVMADILRWHEQGTRYNIHMASDGLLEGGTDGVQLTWMDAKAGDWVVTPRQGKAVEVNALWYNAWKIFAWLHRQFGFENEFLTLSVRAEHIKEQFIRTFYYAEGGYLYDLVRGDYKDTAIRPNQLFAISLPFPLLDLHMGGEVLHVVERDLLTPRGLRSLAPSHPDYKRIYLGDRYARDGAYHQGTVWSWLIGPYVDALVYIKGVWGRRAAQDLLRDFFMHLGEAGIGSVSEIFDAEVPYTPRGCIAQAWSVAELLRVSSEYGLFSSPTVSEQGPAVKVLDRHLDPVHRREAETFNRSLGRMPLPARSPDSPF